MRKKISFTNKQLLKTINVTQKCPFLPEITNSFDKNSKKLILAIFSSGILLKISFLEFCQNDW